MFNARGVGGQRLFEQCSKNCGFGRGGHPLLSDYKFFSLKSHIQPSVCKGADDWVFFLDQPFLGVAIVQVRCAPPNPHWFAVRSGGMDSGTALPNVQLSPTSPGPISTHFFVNVIPLKLCGGSIFILNVGFWTPSPSIESCKGNVPLQ